MLVEETNSPKNADELLKAYAGRETELLNNLRKLKAKQDKDAEVREEVERLVKETNAPKVRINHDFHDQRTHLNQRSSHFSCSLSRALTHRPPTRC